MLEIYVLEQLKAFAEFGTLSAAAEHLHLAQPSLSRSMQKLEDNLGVKLFERRKNRITLNAAGELAARCAVKILQDVADMEQRVRAFDRSLRTVSIGSCAPGPLMLLLPQVADAFPGMTVSSGIETEKTLLRGLKNGDYGLIILNHPIDSEEFFCRAYVSEQLFLSVNHFHPAAIMKSVSFEDVDGQNFIMHARVGFWEQIVRKKMPHAKFFLQEDMDAVGELQRSSDLPSFVTDITLRVLKSRQNNRAVVPFRDPDAIASYYFVGQASKQTFFSSLLKDST
ncbi:MAG: LysR family transcriptional regulator [Clostridia bacterium]|nr:LysR family transcriptional regulator [Clostridia bacterium]